MPILLPRRVLMLVAVLGCLLGTGPSAHRGLLGADWPQWRRDAARSGASEEELPAAPGLVWVVELAPPSPAWPETQGKLQFDRLYEPVLSGKTLFVPSMVEDRLIAIDTETGKERWSYFVDGPVRFAPAVWRDRVFFVSDDGWLYALHTEDGSLLWKFRGGPSDRKVLGNDRLISMWPARGAPVVYDDKVYFGAGVWPFMGIFLHALDAESGEVIWTNSGSGSEYIVQQHSSPAFAGVAPQGYLAATEDHLVVSGGRTVPAVYDRRTGKFLQYNVQSRDMGSKGGGGYEVIAGKDFYVNRGALYRMRDGKFVDHVESPVLTRRLMIGAKDSELRGYYLGFRTEKERDRRGQEQEKLVVKRAWTATFDMKLEELFLKSGSRVYGRAEKREIVAIDLPTFDAPAHVSWRRTLPDTALNMITGDGKLFITTEEGRIYCFGETEKEVEMPKPIRETLVFAGSEWRYRDRSRAPDSSWTAADFDDSEWRSGKAPLGYGDNGEETRISFGRDERNKNVAAWFRRELTVPEGKRYKEAKLEVRIDDGAILYLDGAEVGRLFMPRGEIKPDTLAESGTDEKTYYSIDLDPRLLTPGRHVLAAEVRQVSRSSSDLTFDARLIATPRRATERPTGVADEWSERATEILRVSGARGGWCLVLGLGSGRLAEEIARQSELRVVIVDTDSAAIETLRRRLAERGEYGPTIAAVTADPDGVELPPYFAELVVSEDPEGWVDLRTLDSLARLYGWLRPTSGAAVFELSPATASAFASTIEKAALDLPRLQSEGRWSVLSRPELPTGSGEWTHQYGDAANTVASDDRIVRAPLGLLWFGGPSHEGVLPRHGHGPTPHVAGGRIVIEGRDMVRALDLYTGRLLWQREFPDIGKHYDYSSHEPGANEIGSNYVTLADVIYVVYQGRAHELDATTGKTRRVFELPKGGDEDAEWGFIAVEGDILLGGARAQGNQVPVFTDREVAELKGEALLDAAKRVRSWLGFDPRERKADDKEKETDAASKLFVLDNLNKLLVEPGFLDRIPERVRNSVKDKGKLAELEKKLVEYHLVPGRRADDFDAVVLKRHLLHLYYGLPDFTAQAPGRFGSVVRSGSRKLVAFDRTTGEVLWERSARFEMRPNAIVAGGGKAFFLDRLPEREAALRLRRGEAPAEGERLVAIDLRTGEDLWSSEERIFGTWLGYSAKHDVLLQAGARSRDRSHDEVGRGMIAYRGTSGDVVWSNDLPYDGPCVLLEDRLITQGHSAPGFALDVRTGEKVTTPHPVTGAPVEWRYTRNYGCNTAIGCPQLLTFRSAAAGFYDLASVGGTGNLGGFRSGCTSNLIPAGGVIAAPDYTRDCTCAYQNQASLALVPMPEVEMWTFTSFDSDRQPVDHVGINFGAPGDRRADDGTLWLDWPSRGGKSPDLNVVVSKELESSSVRYHASRVAGGAAPEWVGASGLVGAGEIRIEVIPAGDEIAVPNEITTGKTLVAKRGRLSPSRPFAVHPDGSRNHHVLAVADKKDFDARIEKDPTLATESITVELWLRSDHDDPTWIDARGKPAEGEEQPKSGFVLRERDLELVYWLRKPDGTIESVELEGSKSIEKNRWYHVAWTYDATTGRGELFLDGERIDETEIDAGSVLHWGDEPADWRLLPSPSDRAALDELRVASRALPVDEFLPRAERAPEGIVGHWRMDARTSKEGMLSFSYSVRLIFAELDERGPGERVFDIVVNDVHRLEGIDPARAAGGPYRTWVEELRGVTVNGWLRLELESKSDAPPILCGIELRREKETACLEVPDDSAAATGAGG